MYRCIFSLVTVFIMHELLLNMQEDNCTFIYIKHLLCIYFFSSPGPMVPVRYCHHLAFIVIIGVVIVNVS